MTAIPEATSAIPKDKGPGRSDWPWKQGALLIGSGILALHPVSVTWSSNANYSFGWWIPLVALFLFYERWPMRPPRMATVRHFPLAPLLVLWALVFIPFRVAAESDPDWRPGLWIIVGIYIGALLIWLSLYGGAGWRRYFAFPVLFLFLCVPWPFEIEHPLVQALMRWNTLLVTISLQLLGIPAVAEGNIIDLPQCRLGVEEACSGILSLQASVMMGFLLGEIYHLPGRRRGLLVLLTMGLALIGNYGRTFFLALMASFFGLSAVNSWHDTAGYSILVFTGVGSWLVCLCLITKAEPRVPAVATGTTGPDYSAQTGRAQFLAAGLLAVTVLTEISTQAWYGWRESKIPHQPEWTALFPKADSFKPIPVPETTQGILLCDGYKAGSWEDPQKWRWSCFWFRYNPKPSNRVVLGWHTPDNCLPSVGLKKDLDYPDFIAKANGLQFLVQPRRFSSESMTLYLFWVIYPTSGDLPSVIDNKSHAPYSTKFRTHLEDVWKGYRGVGVETLEMAVEGPTTYEAAQAAYLDQLKKLVVPNSAVNTLVTGPAH